MAQTELRSPRRSEMVAVAARLFSERGYHGTSMQDLADELGLLRGSLYAHIGSKEERLFDVVDDGADRFLARVYEAKEARASATETLRHVLVGHVETAIDHLEAATVFLNEWRYLSPELRSVVQEKRDRYEEMVRSIITDGVTEGDFRPNIDTALATRLVLSAGNWVYTWYRPDGNLTPRAVGELFADMISTGLEKRNGRGWT